MKGKRGRYQDAARHARPSLMQQAGHLHILMTWFWDLKHSRDNLKRRS